MSDTARTEYYALSGELEMLHFGWDLMTDDEAVSRMHEVSGACRDADWALWRRTEGYPERPHGQKNQLVAVMVRGVVIQIDHDVLDTVLPE